MLTYTAPATVEEAVRALVAASGVAKVLSGGTDLLVQLRSGRAKPDLIVDIKRIPEMSGIHGILKPRWSAFCDAGEWLRRRHRCAAKSPKRAA